MINGHSILYTYFAQSVTLEVNAFAEQTGVNVDLNIIEAHFNY